MIAEVDAVIAGGGVAGASATAALARIGWSVLVVEPGQHDDRRLAGEFIHPAGVAGLARLGLLTEAFSAAARLDGFAVFAEAAGAAPTLLSYAPQGAEPRHAIALAHAALCRSLLAGLSQVPQVSIARGWRVTGTSGASDRPIVELRSGGIREQVACRMVVAADGASSSVRSHAGIRHRRVRKAVLTGYVVPQDALPLPARGHIFTTPDGPVLAYAMGQGRARVLFDTPLSGGPAPSLCTASLPPRLRLAAEAAIAAGSGLSFTSSNVSVSAVARGRIVLVGDAAGSCHPITATGMTMGIEDAIRLAGAVSARDGDVGGALSLYARGRRGRQRARLLLAALLHDVLGSAGPEMGLLRAGLHRHWASNAKAREVSMALLGMDELRTRTILAELGRVTLASVLAGGERSGKVLQDLGLVARLSLPLMRHLASAMRVP